MRDWGVTYAFLKGHGTENDFVLLPDHDGSVHGELDAARVRALCDRRAGLGADGVLRVIRSVAMGVDGPEWFMDYRNADGSASEMCGNGIRVFVRHLVDDGLATLPVEIGTRAGVKTIDGDGDLLTADLGSPRTLGGTLVGVGDLSWPAMHVDMGNPHAVAFVDDLADAGHLLAPPDHDHAIYPHGVNVEFVVRRGDRHVAMRVHERGAGETRSCGTGAGAVMVASALADRAERPVTYRVDVPGGELAVTWTAEDHVLLTGPAVVVASGVTDI
ncbi:MAG: diaminopimelate epimerase [Nocardioides sp.]|nr:diaminopimelate epimerase [Nocardioides sp.]